MDRRLPGLQGAHPYQFGCRRNSLDRDRVRSFFTSCTSTLKPARLFRLGPRRKYLLSALELRGVGIGGAADPRRCRRCPALAVGVIEQHAVADPHLVAHEVGAPDSCARRTMPSSARHRGEIVDAAIARFWISSASSAMVSRSRMCTTIGRLGIRHRRRPVSSTKKRSVRRSERIFEHICRRTGT